MPRPAILDVNICVNDYIYIIYIYTYVTCIYVKFKIAKLLRN
jgi:hypothetical protein